MLFDVTSRVTAAGTVVSARLGEPDGAADELVFEVSPEAELAPVDRADGFFPIALLMAMRQGRPLHVSAPLSPKLLYHANAYLGAIVQRIHRDHRAVPVTASDLRPAPVTEGRGVCAGFSGGVDSFALLQEHFLEPTVPGFRLTHLLFNDVGSHRPRDLEGVFQRRLDRIRRIAAELGLPLIVTRSNQSDLLGFDFMRFDALRNATVPLLLQSRMNRFFYGAAVTLEDLGVYPHDAIDMAEPALLPLASTEAMELISTGAQHTRIAKIQRLAELPLAHRHLDVCVNSPAEVVNCGRCPKCVRTVFTLELLGVLEPFRHLFDMQAYARTREDFLVRMLYSRSMLMRQVRELARDRSYSIPQRLRAWAWLKHRVLKGLRPA